MVNKSSDLQKQNAHLCLVAARQRWDGLGIKYADYTSDRDAFYKAIRKEILPEFVRQGGDEDIFLEVMREHARNDWIMSGFDEKKFDQKFRKAKRRASFRLLLGVIGSVLVLLIEALIEKFFEISISKHIKPVVQ